MSNWKTIAGTAGIVGLMMAAGGPASAETAASPAGGTVVLKDQKGKSVGTLTLTAGESGIAMSVKLTGLPPGVHGFHIHDKGICEGDFATAGGHFNPGHARHGILAEAGRHAGDLPNLDVPASGELNVDLFLTGVSLTPGSPINLHDQDGASFVVHAGPDDYKSDPSGNSGGRIACGVLEVTKPAAAAAPK